MTLAGTSLAAQGPESVSPGHPSHVTGVESRCPTFSFGGAAGARSYELAVYELDEGQGEEEDERLVLREEIPGRATTFTPALENCLERGRRYAWSVRAIDPKGPGEWSTPRLFEVADAPGEAELAEALEVVRRYAAAHGEASPAAGLAPDEDSGGEEPTSAAGGGVERLPVTASATETALSVDGGVAASFFAGDGSALVNLPPASDVACSGCVSGSEVANFSLTGDDIATGSLTGTDIQNGSIGEADLGSIFPVAVECDGSCHDVSLGQVCDASAFGSRPIAVSCGNVQEHSGGLTCGSGNTCYGLNELKRSHSLGTYCDDGGGADVLVFCMFP
ncbi:MAG: hypothetical protein ACLF0P_02815 [Thermoanaerobaculia bacterium]